MGVFIAQALIHDLMHQKSDIEYQLTKITREKKRYTDYAGFVGQDKFTIGTLLSSPGALLGRTLNYMGFSQDYAMDYQNQRAAYHLNMAAMQNGGNLDPQMQEYILNQLYLQGREKAKEIEEQNLKNINEELDNEQERLKTLLQEVEDELKAAREMRQKDMQDMAPKYTAGGQ